MSDGSPHHLHPDAIATIATTPPEVSLLLRAHSEQRWLSREVVPVLRQIETRERLPDDQLPAALAYLEVIWSEALYRAGETDAACTRLALSLPVPAPSAPATSAHLPSPDAQAHAPEHQPLAARARRYRAAVVVLRETVSRRVFPLLSAPPCWSSSSV